MATKPRRGRPPAAPRDDDDVLGTLDIDRESIAEMELSEFLDGVGASATFIAVYRAGKPGEPDAFLENVGAAGFTEQTLRDQYGAGKYKLRFKAPDARGRNVYLAHKTVVVGELRVTAAAAAPGGAAAPGSVEYFREENKRQFELILALVSSQKGQSLDVGALMTGMAALLTAVNGPKNDLGGMVQAFTALKTAAEPRDPMQQLGTTVDLVKKLMPDKTTEEGWSGVAKEVLTFLGGPPGASRPAIAPASLAPAARLEPAASSPELIRGGAPGDDEPENEPTEGMMTTEQWLRAQIEFLKSKAASGKPVAPWIQYTIENQDEGGCAAIVTAFRAGATFDHLLGYFPEIAASEPLRVWFRAFYDGVHKQLFAAGDGNSGRAPGNPGDAPGNADSGLSGQAAPSGANGSGFAWESPRG